MHYHVHLPMKFTEEEKPLVLEYLKRFKHSELSIKMLMCAYFGGAKYREGFISLESYLKWCLRDNISNNEKLSKFWSMDAMGGNFFDFPKKTILEGSLNDTEKMIAHWLFVVRPSYYPVTPQIN